MALIREAAASQQGDRGWQTYDEQFRLRQESQPKAWNLIHPELWLRIMTLSQYHHMPISAGSTEMYGRAAACMTGRGHMIDFNCKHK
jgi:hypothetical protein